jgi:AraC-like DNA-binding protein
MLVRMSRRTRTTAIALTGAVAVSSVAYGLGSQRGDGSAAALGGAPSTESASDRGAGPFGGHRGPGLGDLADRLGVSTDKLEAALEDIRGDRSGPEDHHAEMAEDLASELGVPADRVTAALEKLRGDHGDRHEELTAALASKLGVGASKLRAAFEELRGDGRRDRGPRAGAAALARELGIGAAKVRSAFRELRDELGPPPRHRDRDDFAADLADELGVSESAVQDAFDKVGEAKRDEFAAALAQRLDLSVGKVEEVLDSLPHHEGRGRP